MNNLSKILLSIIIILVTTIIVLLSIFLPNKEEENVYDVSTMNQVYTKDVLNFFETKKTYLVFVGWENCGVCHKLAPTLAKVQIEKNFITQYLDITKVDRESMEWISLVEKFDIITTESIDATDAGEKKTDTFGYFLDEHGFTPTLIIISDGKMKAGYIGNQDEETLVNWLEENGI